MKKFFTFLFFLFWTFCSFAQFQLENINCIILIDGKLPRGGQGFVEYNNEFNKKDTAFFDYDVGTIEFKSTDLEKLRALPDTAMLPNTTNVTIHINFVEFDRIKCIRTKHHYYSSFPLFGLFYNSCIVFSITNFDKKKGTYYFDFAVSNFQKGWSEGYNKKHQIFHDYRPCMPKKSRR